MPGLAWEDPRSGGKCLVLAQLGAEYLKVNTLTFIQNRAQSVKAKLHTWCNPMESSLNMNPSPTRSHIA